MPSRKLEHATRLYMEGIRDGDVRRAVETYTGDRYTQHSTGVADGVDGFVAFFEPFIERNPVRDIRILRSVVDGQYVFLHVYQDINNGEARWVTADLFDTDENDLIIEHWDVIAPFVDDTASGHSQVDGATQITDLDKTESNKAVVAGFLNDVLVEGRVEKLGEYVSARSYTQHNPQIADGIAGLEAFLNGLAQRGQKIVYENIFKIIGQGNFVVSYSLADVLGQKMAVFDIFRLENGLLVEHWDNLEPIPEGPQPNRGKF
ncbi:MAG: nuclear transport factor 2 family protein [Acidobacteriota bacterium]